MDKIHNAALMESAQLIRRLPRAAQPVKLRVGPRRAKMDRGSAR
jgi:hypothetical protein